jgi:hypothetical protein
LDKNKFAVDWLKFLIVSDHISKVLLAVSVSGLVVFGTGGFQATTMGMIFGILLIVSLLVSLGSYLFIGKFREACVKKFYDAVGSSGDLPSEYRGRELKRIKVVWKGRQAKSVHFTVSTNSRAVTSRYEWRTVKRAASENFKFVEKNILIFLEDQSSGVFRFTSASDAELANSPEAAIAVSKENMYSFAYEALSSSGHTLPSIRNFEAELTVEGRVTLNAVTLQFDQQLSSYDIKRFESAFNRQYQNAGSQWTFEWSSSDVVIKSVERGSSHERIISATKSLETLIESASSTALSIYNREEYLFNSKDIQWGERPIHVENFTIDFLRSDISRPDRVEKFEALMEQGLKQLFPKSNWKFTWDVDAFRKAVYITKIAEAELIRTPVAHSADDNDTAVSPVAADIRPMDEPAPASVLSDTTPAVTARDATRAPRPSLPARPTLDNLPPRPPRLNL